MLEEKEKEKEKKKKEKTYYIVTNSLSCVKVSRKENNDKKCIVKKLDS